MSMDKGVVRYALTGLNVFTSVPCASETQRNRDAPDLC